MSHASFCHCGGKQKKKGEKKKCQMVDHIIVTFLEASQIDFLATGTLQ